VYSFYVTMALPLIPFAVGFVFTALAWAWSSVPILQVFVGMTKPRWRLGFMCKDGAQVYEYFLGWMAFAIPFLNITYNVLCTKILNTFSCFQLRDGTYALNVAPDVKCWDNLEHHAMVGVSSLGIVVYVLGIPAYVLATMSYAMHTRGASLLRVAKLPLRRIARDCRYAHHKDRLKDALVLDIFGFLYTKYGPLLALSHL